MSVIPTKVAPSAPKTSLVDLYVFFGDEIGGLEFSIAIDGRSGGTVIDLFSAFTFRSVLALPAFATIESSSKTAS